MKTAALFLVVILFASFHSTRYLKSAEEKEFSIVISTDSLVAQKFQFSYSNDSTSLQGVITRDGNTLTLKGSAKYPQFSKIYLFGTYTYTIPLLLEPGKSVRIFAVLPDSIKGYQKVRYEGSSLQNDLNEWNRQIEAKERAYRENEAKWLKALIDKRFSELNELEDRSDKLLGELTESQLHYFEKNHASILSGLLINRVLENNKNIDLQRLLKIYNRFSDGSRNLPDVTSFYKNLTRSLHINIGSTISDFSLPDTSGNMISLSHLKGKYVLIDFWAGWCKPCRWESPLLVKTYHQYKEKGFEILSVSFDDKREVWTKAITTDQYAWYNVSELKRWRNQLNEKWFINSIPDNILIDPDGKIIGRNLRGLRLEKRLKDIFRG